MELIEPIDVLNQRLIDYFGIDTLSGMPMWRIVFSEDQLERQLCEYSESGLIELAQPEVRLVPKYKQWIKSKYILEQLVLVPDGQQDQIQTKLSYEPFYVFMGKADKYLPPKWEVAQFLIDTSLAARGKTSLKKYSDGIKTQEDEFEAQRKRVDDIIEYLGGDESGLMGATLPGGNGIVVPHPMKGTES